MSAPQVSRQSDVQGIQCLPSELETSICVGVLSHHAAPAGIPPTDIHYDFISFLAIAQRLNVDFLPITWQPALDSLGKGATAEVSQSLVNLQMSFAFKRTALSNLPWQGQYQEQERRALRALISEVSVLSHPLIRRQANIINLEGICWEIGREDKVLPVLVFEKAQLGDMHRFMDSDLGKALSIEDRLKMCIGVGTAVMVMHSCRKFQ